MRRALKALALGFGVLQAVIYGAIVAAGAVGIILVAYRQSHIATIVLLGTILVIGLIAYIWNR